MVKFSISAKHKVYAYKRKEKRFPRHGRTTKNYEEFYAIKEELK